MGQSNCMFVTYLDEYNKITIIVPKSYYGGENAPFYLKEKVTGTIIDLKIEEKHCLGDFIKYVASILGFVELEYQYEVLDCYQNKSPLKLGYITRTEKFNKNYRYCENDLGYVYTKDKTTFKVWSPTATNIELSLKIKQKCCLYKMKRQSHGVWSVSIEGDLDGSTYHYVVTNNDVKQDVIDPYAFSSTANGEESVVVDLNKTIQMNEEQPNLNQLTDAIIYEVSIRDFTTDVSSNVTNKGKFLGLIESGELDHPTMKSGLDYLLSLGVTHIQLLPIFDFEGVDELCPEKSYNWGYNPSQYNVPEGSYSTDATDAYARINELKQMINTLHKNGLGVIMDVVYNHVYNYETHPFDKLVPTYYYRYDYQGMPSNATGCGNDLATERFMVRSYIVNSVKYYATEYKIDGFRFDLMGILDVDTMNEIRRECHKINPNIILYGEGWDMPTTLPQQQKAVKFNAHNMPYIGHFNDEFRDVIKGSTFNHQDQGFALGNVSYIESVKQLLAGSCGLLENETHLFYYPSQSINYVECHDNHTFYDRTLLSNHYEDESVRQKRQLLATAMVIFSQGIPFIHCGQEFFRSKKGVENSYNASDEINAINWNDVILQEQAINLVTGYIKIRKSHGAFRLATSNLVKKHLRMFNHHHSVIEYNLKNVAAYGAWDEIKVFFNVQNQAIEIPLITKGFYKIADDQVADIILKDLVETTLTIPPLSTVILVKPH